MTAREQYLESVLAVTGGEDWRMVQEGLMSDISNLISQELSAETLPDIMETRGFRKALEYVHDLRELAKTEKANTDASI